MAEQPEGSGPQAPGGASPLPGGDDGYEGPATLTVGPEQLDVQVQLRGHFEPVDGRYHWYGRIGRHDGVTKALRSGRAAATLATGHGSAPCEISDPDTWQRYRVTGISTPPFATAMSAAGAAAVASGGVASGGVASGGVASGGAAPAAGPAARRDPAGAAGGSLPDHVRIAIIGAGFGGLGIGIRLRQAGRSSFVILERGGSVGGTWRDNTYPGCACDVPSHLYSFSFAPNPGWSRSFSRQPEIRRYLEQVTRRYQMNSHIRFGTEVTGAQWDAARARWQIQTSRGKLTADVLISAGGPLSEPSIPDIPGLAEFPGEVFHSARWNHDYDLTGQRVAVVGTGASAIQLVPAIQPAVGKLVLFQRTPAWVLPRRDRQITATEQWLYAHLPPVQQLARLGIYLSRESTVGAFTKRPQLLRAAQRMALRNLAAAVPDPQLRAKLTPSYIMGCKRILLSSDYYPALTQPNVEVVASGLAKVDGAVVTAQDGSAHEVDAIIFATGFHVTDMPIAERIRGADGRSLAQVWGGDMRALRGTTVAGFPNLCLVVGPNTGLGHTSIVHIIESQVNYILDYLATLDRSGGAALDTRPAAQERWCADIEQRMGTTVWATGGCSSWYLNAAGRNPTLWPASTLRFRHETRRVDPAEYDVIPAGGHA